MRRRAFRKRPPSIRFVWRSRAQERRTGKASKERVHEAQMTRCPWENKARKKGTCAAAKKAAKAKNRTSIIFFLFLLFCVLGALIFLPLLSSFSFFFSLSIKTTFLSFRCSKPSSSSLFLPGSHTGTKSSSTECDKKRRAAAEERAGTRGRKGIIHKAVVVENRPNQP